MAGKLVGSASVRIMPYTGEFSKKLKEFLEKQEAKNELDCGGR